jgi:hypothetical protein
MAYSIGGPNTDKDYNSWGSIMQYATWTKCDSSQAEATAEDGSLFLNGSSGAFNFEMTSGFESIAYLMLNLKINSDYVPELVGRLVTPCGQGEPVQPGSSFTPSPCAPFDIEAVLFEDLQQELPDPPRPNGSYITGIESIDGLTDQT